MKIIVFVAKTGDWLVSFVAAILATVMLLYGGYALWDTAMLYQGAFASGNLMKYKPSVSVDEDDASLEELLAINPDVRGWLTIDGTHVDYPIVQGEDDMEYVNKDDNTDILDTVAKMYMESFHCQGPLFWTVKTHQISATVIICSLGIIWQMVPCLGMWLVLLTGLILKSIRPDDFFIRMEAASKLLCMRVFRRMLLTVWCIGRKSGSRKTWQNSLHISKKKLCSTGTSELLSRIS